MILRTPIFCAVLCAVLAGDLHAIPRYDVVDLGTLGGNVRGPSHDASWANDINNNGTIVGAAYLAGNRTWHAFVYRKGRMRDLDAGLSTSRANAVNNGGVIVGDAWLPPTDQYRAYIRRHKRAVDLGAPGGEHSYAYGINAKNQAVGIDYARDHAVIFEKGRAKDLGTLPGGRTSAAYAINDAGKIVGASSTREGQDHAVIFDRGSIIDLHPLMPAEESGANSINNHSDIVGFAVDENSQSYAVLWRSDKAFRLHPIEISGESTARDINNLGQIVGWRTRRKINDYDDWAALRRAVIFQDGAMIDLNQLIPRASRWTLLEARAINDRGQIVGVGRNSKGVNHAVLLNPRE